MTVQFTYSDSMGISYLVLTLLEIPPFFALSAAENMVSLLQYVFRLSSDLIALDEKTAPEELPDAVYRYFLHELKSPSHRSPTYGILMQERFSGSWATIRSSCPFSHDRAAVIQIIQRCTKLYLSPEHPLGYCSRFPSAMRFVSLTAPSLLRRPVYWTAAIF